MRNVKRPPASSDRDPYAQLPDLYDLEHASFDEDLDLYLQLAEVVGDPVLELGCGSGRVLLALAAAGHRVTGLDQSQPMLARATTAVAEAGLSCRVSLHLGQMQDAGQVSGGPFGLVLVPLNGLLHLTTAAEQRATLEAIHDALDPRGQLAIDLLNPTPDALHAFNHALTHEGEWQLDNGNRVDKFAARSLIASEQLIRTDLWYDQVRCDGTVLRTATRFDMRYLHRAELELLLELTGFTDWQIYGSYDLEPFDDQAERIIVTAEVTPPPRGAKRIDGAVENRMAETGSNGS
ncbi:MAG: methyltransferase domain-containing protein [Chloroflexota bacterium]|nr:methyltransferase domain-containing protein [Chloroflexota bacterium]